MEAESRSVRETETEERERKRFPTRLTRHCSGRDAGARAAPSGPVYSTPSAKSSQEILNLHARRPITYASSLVKLYCIYFTVCEPHLPHNNLSQRPSDVLRICMICTTLYASFLNQRSCTGLSHYSATNIHLGRFS